MGRLRVLVSAEEVAAPVVRRWTIWRSGLELFHVIDCEDYPRMLAELAGLPVVWDLR